MTVTDNSGRRSVSGLLLGEIYQGATIQSLLDKIYDTWYYPSMFLNLSRHIEYYSSYSSEYDPWGSLFHNGALDQDILDRPIREVLANRRSGNSHDRMRNITINGETYILTLVRYVNAPIGFLLMHCTRSRSDNDAALISSSLSEAIAFLIERDPAVNMPDHDYMRNYIARELLQFDEIMDSMSPAAGTTEYMASLLWPNIRPAYRIAAITIEDDANESLKDVEKEIFLVLPENYTLIKGNTLYIFFYDLDAESDSSDANLKERLKNVADNNAVVIALSSRFSDIEMRQVYRRQAVDLSRREGSVKRQDRLLNADNYYPEQMVYASQKRIGSEVLMLSELTNLRAYDEKNGTEYLKTLCVYLRYCGIVRCAAAELHIEPKSLRYRINKICGILLRSREELLSDKALLLSSIASSPLLEEQKN